ncbi:hypothetical protein EV363DRAFT_1340845 [Boletus edulis]|nr:hypothetical protein EV363DRAFT_1340845 [Boletus edulis]
MSISMGGELSCPMVSIHVAPSWQYTPVIVDNGVRVSSTCSREAVLNVNRQAMVHHAISAHTPSRIFGDRDSNASCQRPAVFQHSMLYRVNGHGGDIRKRIPLRKAVVADCSVQHVCLHWHIVALNRPTLVSCEVETFVYSMPRCLIAKTNG